LVRVGIVAESVPPGIVTHAIGVIKRTAGIEPEVRVGIPDPVTHRDCSGEKLPNSCVTLGHLSAERMTNNNDLIQVGINRLVAVIIDDLI